MLSRCFHFGVFEIFVSSLFLLVLFAFWECWYSALYNSEADSQKEDHDGGSAHVTFWFHQNTPSSTPASSPSSAGVPFTTDNENILRLVKAIGHRQLSVKEMLAAVGLKDRMNFMEYSLTPAMTEGFVCLLYPDKPRHPRQKYLLTVKGSALYNELTKDTSKWS